MECIALIAFLVGAALGFAAGTRHGWNGHIAYKLDETIERAERQAAEERR